MKGDASTHVYTDKGRENHDRIFGKKEEPRVYTHCEDRDLEGGFPEDCGECSLWEETK